MIDSAQNNQKASPPPLHLLLCEPRGFCAGVERAILIVEKALAQYGAPVYVRHEIVHNKYVLDSLRAKGAIFVKTLDEVAQDRPVIFSAHGVAKAVPEDARAKNLFYLDATCPLVSKVHIEAERHFKNNRHIIMIGHAGHPEVIGTMGQLPKGAMTLVETIEDVTKLIFTDDIELSFITQTTLSVDDTAEIVSALQKRFPRIKAPHKEDICYATSNRQDAVKAIAPRIDALVVLGSKNSSNSNRLVEVAQKYGCHKAILIDHADDMPADFLKDVKTLGLTAGASAPDVLIDGVIAKLKDAYAVTLETVTVAREDLTFKLPRELAG
jgi:4-hydroxy-3-methylbut-2-enyl diphosphate reductase